MDTAARHAANSPAARDIASVVHPYTNLKAHETEGPLIIRRGEGIRVWDDDGKEYIEGMAGLWCTALGFDNDRLADAAAEALRTLPFYHQFTHKSHMPGVELAERLLDMAPVPMARVFFANSGSEANDTAIKLVWYYWNAMGKPEKKKIVSRQRAYHGVTVATASLTGLPANHADFDLPVARILHTTCPHHYFGANAGESEEDFATRCAEDLEALIQAEGADTIGAMFAEPIMGAGGVVMPPATYFEKIQKVLRKHDILLIADEVICGFFRTGNTWGSQTFGIEPDMLSMAKALSSGYLPISALMVSDRIWQAMLAESQKIGQFGHGFTYSGHPVAAAVAVETQKIYQELDILGHVRAMSPHFQARLGALLDHDLVGEVRGTGLIAGVELVKDKATHAKFGKPGVVGTVFRKAAEKHGLIIRNIVDAIAICPPLIIDKAGIDQLADRAQAAVEDTQKWIEENGAP
jgi:4-aminobutyrate--pyruvate transaminase